MTEQLLSYSLHKNLRARDDRRNICHNWLNDARQVVLANATPWWAFNPAISGTQGLTGTAGQIVSAAAAASDVATANEPQPTDSSAALRVPPNLLRHLSVGVLIRFGLPATKS